MALLSKQTPTIFIQRAACHSSFCLLLAAKIFKPNNISLRCDQMCDALYDVNNNVRTITNAMTYYANHDTNSQACFVGSLYSRSRDIYFQVQAVTTVLSRHLVVKIITLL